MKFLAYNIVLFLLFVIPLKAIECKNNYVQISKPRILIEDFFFGKSFSLYGLVCNNYQYTSITYLDGAKYNIKKYTRDKFGIITPNANKVIVKYYEFYHRSGIQIPDMLQLYDEKNKNITQIMTKNGLFTINNALNMNLKNNGVFKYKEEISKSAKPGLYINEFFVINQNQEIISIHINPFDVSLSGTGVIIEHAIKHKRSLYVIFTILIIISVSCCIVSFLDIAFPKGDK